MNYSPSSNKKTQFEIFQKSVFFCFLNSDFLFSGPVLFHPGPSHSTGWGILSVFFFNSPTALLVCNLLFRNKKEIMRLNGFVNVLFSTAMQGAFHGKQSSFASILVL